MVQQVELFRNEVHRLFDGISKKVFSINHTSLSYDEIHYEIDRIRIVCKKDYSGEYFKFVYTDIKNYLDLSSAKHTITLVNFEGYLNSFKKHVKEYESTFNKR